MACAERSCLLSRRGLTYLRRPALALVDQASTSGAHLVLNVLLARSLELTTYGSFAMAFACSLFVSVIHGGALLDPISIVGPTRARTGWDEYVAGQCRAHLRISTRLAVLPLLLSALAFTLAAPPALVQALMLTGITLPAVLAVTVVKRLLLAADRPERAAVAAVTYGTVVVGGAVMVWRVHHLSLAAAYVLMASAGLLGSLALWHPRQWVGLMRALHPRRHEDGRAEQRKEASALVPAAILAFALSQLALPLVSLLLDTATAGIYRAMQMPMIAAGQVISALSTMALPRFASAYVQGDDGRLRSQVHALATGLLMVCLAFEGLLLLVHEPLTVLLFGERFRSASSLMPIFGLVGVVSCAGTVYGAALRAMRRGSTQVVSTAAAAAAGIPVTVLLTSVYGLSGAAAASVIGYAIFTAMNWHQYGRSATCDRTGSLGPSLPENASA